MIVYSRRLTRLDQDYNLAAWLITLYHVPLIKNFALKAQVSFLNN